MITVQYDPNDKGLVYERFHYHGDITSGWLDGYAVVADLRTLTLTEVNGNWGDVSFDPAPYPPTLPTLKFQAGGSVTLTAEPVDGKSLNHWLIFDANFPNDANHAVQDSNATTTVVMDTDRHVEAIWKCGGGASLWLPMILGILGLSVWARRSA